MKNWIKYCASVMALATLVGCSDNNAPDIVDGEGTLVLHPSYNIGMEELTRADGARKELTEDMQKKAIIWIDKVVDGKNSVIHKFRYANPFPAEGLPLISGNYVAEAWTGDSVSASWDKLYYKGYEPFAIQNGQTSNVEIECSIANALVSFEPTDEAKAVLKNMTCEIGHDKKTLTHEGTLIFDESIAEGTTAKFMMNSRSKDLVYTLRGINNETNENVEVSGTIEGVKGTTQYHLIVRYTPPKVDPQGGGHFEIDVDETEILVKHDFVLEASPSVRVVGMEESANVTLTSQVGKFEKKSLWITATSPMKSIELSSPAFAKIAGFNEQDFELFAINDNAAYKTALNNAGINWIYYTHEKESDPVMTKMSEMKVNFEPEFLNMLAEGSYDVTVTATDENGRVGKGVITITPSSAKVQVIKIDPASPELRSRSAVLQANRISDEAAGYGIMVRKKGTSAWTKFPATGDVAVGENYSVKAEGLVANTVYEYAAYCDGFESGDLMEFTTEKEEQLPNAGFEEWGTDGSVTILASTYANAFWDCGNWGSATMNKNVTEKESNIKHSGNYSAKLASQFVGLGIIGKFAAGNLFAGKYLKTDGTDGVLGWGRPFESRPKALKLWVKFTPEAITDVGSGTPSGVAKGDPDMGIIYVALTDPSQETFEGTSWAKVVKTKSSERSLFNSGASNVIAYGELVLSEATAGAGMVEMTIPLDYRKDIRPSQIILVASASRYGDYFTGGRGTTMYLDDLEFIYE